MKDNYCVPDAYPSPQYLEYAEKYPEALRQKAIGFDGADAVFIPGISIVFGVCMGWIGGLAIGSEAGAVIAAVMLGLIGLVLGLRISYAKYYGPQRRSKKLASLKQDLPKVNLAARTELLRIEKQLNRLPAAQRQECFPLWERSVEAAQWMTASLAPEPVLLLQERLEALTLMADKMEALETTAREEEARLLYSREDETDLMVTQIYTEALEEGSQRLKALHGATDD